MASEVCPPNNKPLKTKQTPVALPRIYVCGRALPGMCKALVFYPAPSTPWLKKSRAMGLIPSTERKQKVKGL